MSKQACNDLIGRLQNAVDHIRKEYDNLSYSELIGALRMVTREVEDEWLNGPDEDDPDDKSHKTDG